MLEMRSEDSCIGDLERYFAKLSTADIQLHAAKALKEQLDIHTPRLFCTEDRADLLIFERYRLDEDFSSHRLKTRCDLGKHLSKPARDARPDPRCRYVFIHAPHSRSSLYITRAMLLDVLTYHRIMPVFLEYIFPFGKQGGRRDAYGGSFRSESRLAGDEPGSAVQTLGRSGRQLEFCYSLQSVERSEDSRRPWSIRMCVVWHNLDLENERQAWLVVKGNKSMQETLMSYSKSLDVNTGQHESHLSRALRLSLGSHLELVKWSVQNWQWYLTTLEQELQDKTGRAMSTRAIAAASTVPSFGTALSPASTVCEDSHYTPLAKTTRFSASQLTLRMSCRRTDSQPIGYQETEQGTEPGIVPEEIPFSFDDLQRLQSLEEKANAMAMITDSNSEVIRQLRAEYRTLLDTDTCTAGDIEAFKKSIKRFERKLYAVEAELTVLRARVQTFSRLLKERKDLLYAALQYKETVANSQVAKQSCELAKQSQLSNQNMEMLSLEMHKIAQATQVETVSMRTITVVTLIFLPGTFISTLMSTPIVTFTDGPVLLSDRNISLGALQFYCAVSVPLMAFTFISWYLVYWWEKKKVHGRSRALARLALHA